jgi:hypothetical protein
MNSRQCIDCGKPIEVQLIGRRCRKCLNTALESTDYASIDPYTIKDVADIMNLTSDEYVRKLSREKKIPGRIACSGKQHRFFPAIINQWHKQNHILPKVPTNPLQEEAKMRCENKDHDWLMEERFEGIAYQVEKDIPQSGVEVLKTGYRYRRVCYFCGYSTTVADFPNL